MPSGSEARGAARRGGWPRRHGLARGVLAVALSLLSACALLQTSADVPSAAPPAPTAAERREAARLYRDGLRALNPPRRGAAGDPDGAARLIEAAANLGDPDAQMMVAAGHLYRPDGGRDAAAALPWLHRAAQQGNKEAQYRLARLLEAGEGTRREPAWAAVWFQRAAERGHPEAQYALALMQIVGEGTARDEAEALARLSIAERRGVTPARRYREALQPRVPPAAARAAAARVGGETAQGPVATVDRPLVRFVQSGLMVRGGWPGAVDGRDGPATRAALAEFARREGVSPEPPYGPAAIDRLRERLAGG
ncbi:tetratricopeptide repeat protein [Neoroseomonas soli]|uniref:Sel1 repeat family protein n=1 Tax=Neoroseomonas soli TaxID=1081025 RepID=A0A9X9WYZ6_9PROT|nr:tetratricopeptide repeat protein [Neoroseomonas soli]MBR0672375.1 hypothetical protein [Neoroseomonas soli]